MAMFRDYDGLIDWPTVGIVGGALLFGGLVGLHLYGSYGNFEISSTDGVNTRKTVVTLEEGQRFVDVKYACSSKGCAEKIVYTDGGKTVPKTYYIKTVDNLGIVSRMTVIVEK